MIKPTLTKGRNKNEPNQIYICHPLQIWATPLKRLALEFPMMSSQMVLFPFRSNLTSSTITIDETRVDESGVDETRVGVMEVDEIRVDEIGVDEI